MLLNILWCRHYMEGDGTLQGYYFVAAEDYAYVWEGWTGLGYGQRQIDSVQVTINPQEASAERDKGTRAGHWGGPDALYWLSTERRPGLEG